MADQPPGSQIPDEQQTAQQSPIEREFRETEPGTPSPSDRYSIYGYSLSVVVAAVFILFIVLAVIALLVN
jgi:hypothetical protein